jgi:hypothetical protein
MEIDDHAIVEFTTGACGYLAVALHDLTGWSIFAEYEHPPYTEDIAHIWVVNEDGLAVDVNGVHSTAWAKTKYSGKKPGRIAAISRSEALGTPNQKDQEYSDWALELIQANESHFGNPSVQMSPKTG